MLWVQLLPFFTKELDTEEAESKWQEVTFSSVFVLYTTQYSSTAVCYHLKCWELANPRDPSIPGVWVSQVECWTGAPSRSLGCFSIAWLLWLQEVCTTVQCRMLCWWHRLYFTLLPAASFYSSFSFDHFSSFYLQGCSWNRCVLEACQVSDRVKSFLGNFWKMTNKSPNSCKT